MSAECRRSPAAISAVPQFPIRIQTTLGWRAAKYAEAMEVSVPRHQYAISLAGRVPDMLVASTTQPDQTNVQGTREDVLQQIA
jgi:hypothetical protein